MFFISRTSSCLSFIAGIPSDEENAIIMKFLAVSIKLTISAWLKQSCSNLAPAFEQSTIEKNNAKSFSCWSPFNLSDRAKQAKKLPRCTFLGSSDSRLVSFGQCFIFQFLISAMKKVTSLISSEVPRLIFFIIGLMIIESVTWLALVFTNQMLMDHRLLEGSLLVSLTNALPFNHRVHAT